MLPTEQIVSYFVGYDFSLSLDHIIFIYFDANHDGKLNVRDAAHIAKMLAQGKASELPVESDFNDDGKINVRDAAAIAKYLASGKK